MNLPAIASGANISNCGTDRYALYRIWDRALPRIVWTMLNPSTADAETDDATIRRCIGFSQAWGFGALTVVNLFAARATDPKALATFEDPIGPMNDLYLRNIFMAAGSTVVCAWGVHRVALDREPIVFGSLRAAGKTAHCLGMTKDGHPRHPLYVASSTSLEKFR